MEDIKPGYVGFSRSPGVMGRAIRFGEHLSGGVGEWNHMFIIGEDAKVIQAEMQGVTDDANVNDLLLTYKCTILKPPPEVDLDKVVVFAKEQVGICYGLGTDIAIGIDMMTWQWFPAFRGARKPSWICSALGAEALRFGGYYHEWISVYTCTPQQVHDALMAEGAVVVE